MHSYRISAYAHFDDRAAVNAIYKSARRKGDGHVFIPLEKIAKNSAATDEELAAARKCATMSMHVRNANADANRRESLAMSRRYRKSLSRRFR